MSYQIEREWIKLFARIGGLLNALFSDFQSTFITIFAIGILICAVGVWSGDEHAGQRFKKGMIFCAVGLIVFLLAKPIVNYIQTNL